MGKKKEFQKKNVKLQKLSEKEKILTMQAFSEAVIQTFGYNPQYNYTIDKTTKHEDLEKIPSNILEMQKYAINLSDSLIHEFYSCPKFIYKIEDFEIVNSIRKNKDGRNFRKIYHIIGKTKNGYVPFQLITSSRTKKAEDFRTKELKDFESISSSFSVLLNGKNFFVLDRIDNNAYKHQNKFFNGEKFVFESEPDKRVVHGSHKHFYSEEANLTTFKRCKSLIQSPKNNMLCLRILKELDAKPIEKQSIYNIFISYILNANICCFSNFKKDASLGEIFEECQQLKNSFFKTIKPNDEFEKNILRLYVTNKNIKNLKPKREICTRYCDREKL